MLDNAAPLARTKRNRHVEIAMRDDAGRFGEAESSCLLIAEWRPANGGGNTRNQESQSDSQRSAATRLEIGISFLAGFIKTTGGNVRLDLAVPLVGHVFFEPASKRLQFRGRQMGYGRFKFVNAHKLAPNPPARLARLRLRRGRAGRKW